MRASTENVVGVLTGLGFIHLDEPDRGHGGDGDYEFYEYDFDAERRGDDLLQPNFDLLNVPPTLNDDSDPGTSARWRRESAENRISEHLGSGKPPPLADPEAYAWYQPFHYWAEMWGIFVREEGIEAVACALAAFVNSPRHPRVVAGECLRLAHVALRLHEAFHHKIESAAIRLEIATGIEKYHPYDVNVYRPLAKVMSRDLLEEGLANAWMYSKRHTDSKGVGQEVQRAMRPFLEWWIPQLPGAYARGVEFAQDLDTHLLHLTSQLDEARLDPIRPGGVWEVVTHLHDPLQNRLSRHYIVVPRGQEPYLPFRRESKPLALSSRDLDRILRRLGWEQSGSTKGRHPIKYVRPGHPVSIPVPQHPGDLPTGTLAAIARQAGFPNPRRMIEAART